MDRGLQEAAETAVREGLVSLDMSLGLRRAKNVVDDGLVESPDAYEDESWKLHALAPGGMARAGMAASKPINTTKTHPFGHA